MKTISVSLCIIAFLFGITGSSNAALWDRGGGLIYDDVLNITWLQDADYGAGSIYDDGSSITDGRMSWANAVAWADHLEYYDSVRDVNWTNWRLPAAYNRDNSGPDEGYVSGSEMGYMYYENLGNPEGGLINNTSFESGGPGGPIVSFQNTQLHVYWSDTEYSPNPIHAWYFILYTGEQGYFYKHSLYSCAWAVRNGDVSAVPIPSAVLLLGSGLIGLVGFRRKFGKE